MKDVTTIYKFAYSTKITNYFNDSVVMLKVG